MTPYTSVSRKSSNWAWYFGSVVGAGRWGLVV